MLSMMSFCMVFDIPLKTDDELKCFAKVLSIPVLLHLLVVLLCAQTFNQIQSLVNPNASKKLQFHSTVDVIFGFTMPFNSLRQVGQFGKSSGSPGIIQGAGILVKKETGPAK